MWERVRAANPDLIPARIMLASSYAAAGDHAQARILVEEIRAVNSRRTCGEPGSLIESRLRLDQPGRNHRVRQPRPMGGHRCDPSVTPTPGGDAQKRRQPTAAARQFPWWNRAGSNRQPVRIYSSLAFVAVRGGSREIVLLMPQCFPGSQPRSSQVHTFTNSGDPISSRGAGDDMWRRAGPERPIRKDGSDDSAKKERDLSPPPLPYIPSDRPRGGQPRSFLGHRQVVPHPTSTTIEKQERPIWSSQVGRHSR
jgi:hypothetical protein